MSDSLYIIAEIGTSHGGDLGKAKELIAAAAQAGANCAKFQVVYADEIIHPLTGELNLPGGRVRLYDRFLEVEQPTSFYAALKDEVERQGMDFLCSPFGVRSARVLKDIGTKTYKVASPELNHLPLLDELKSYGQPVILSSGVSTLGDIEFAVNRLEGLSLSLLHCITAYPAPPEQYNLRVLSPMSVLFGCPVGISDHSLDPLLVPLSGLVAGARLLEKHFCLSRLDPGLDDPIALDPELFQKMVAGVRSVEALPEMKRRAEVERLLGAEQVDAILGTGRKVLAPAERNNYERTNRSLHVYKDLPRGHRLASGDFAELRTEKVLRPGLNPTHRNDVIGAVLSRPVEAGQGLVWDDLLTKDLEV